MNFFESIGGWCLKICFVNFFLKFWGKMCATTVATCFLARLLVCEHVLFFSFFLNLINFLGTQQ